jgi:multidrug resistance protein, MATE family
VSAARGDDPPGLPPGPLPRKIAVLAWPILAEQLLTLGVGLVQTFLAGTLSKEATAAVGTATYMGWLLSLVFALVSTGVMALISRSFGARDLATANRALGQSIVLAAGVGAVVTAAGVLLAAPIAGFLLAAGAARTVATTYLSISALGYLMVGVTMIANAALRACGDTRTPMLATIVVNVVSLGASVTAVLGFGAGVIAIAVGEVIARTLGAALTLALLAAGRRGLRLRLRTLRPDLAMLTRILRIGVPAAADGVIMTTAQLVFIRIISMTADGEASTATYAAHQIAVRVEAITYAVALACGIATATVAGQYLGADRPRDATRAGHVGAAQGVGVSLVIGLAFVLLADPIYRLMTNDAAVRHVGVPAFRLLAVTQPFVAASQIYLSCLKGVGDTRWPVLATLICGIALRLPLAYLGGVVLRGGLIGAWSGMWADHITRAALAFGRYRHGGWRTLRV